MKTIHKGSLLAVMALLFAGTMGRTLAYDHDDSGWFDNNHVHHAFVHHNGHRGYWDHDNSGARIFINI